MWWRFMAAVVVLIALIGHVIVGNKALPTFMSIPALKVGIPMMYIGGIIGLFMSAGALHALRLIATTCNRMNAIAGFVGVAICTAYSYIYDDCWVHQHASIDTIGVAPVFATFLFMLSTFGISFTHLLAPIAMRCEQVKNSADVVNKMAFHTLPNIVYDVLQSINFHTVVDMVLVSFLAYQPWIIDGQDSSFAFSMISSCIKYIIIRIAVFVMCYDLDTVVKKYKHKTKVHVAQQVPTVLTWLFNGPAASPRQIVRTTHAVTSFTKQFTEWCTALNLEDDMRYGFLFTSTAFAVTCGAAIGLGDIFEKADVVPLLVIVPVSILLYMYFDKWFINWYGNWGVLVSDRTWTMIKTGDNVAANLNDAATVTNHVTTAVANPTIENVARATATTIEQTQRHATAAKTLGVVAFVGACAAALMRK